MKRCLALIVGLIVTALAACGGVANATVPHAVGPSATTGSLPLLVVLVEFEGKPGNYSYESWESYFFGQENSFADYYARQSRGKLLLHGPIVGMRDGVPVTSGSGLSYVHLPNDITYYANAKYGTNPSTFPQNSAGIVRDAIQALDQQGFDFSPYVNPSTKQIEHVIVATAGGEKRFIMNSANAALEMMSSHLSKMGLPNGYTTSTGYRIDRFALSPEGTAIDGSGRLGYGMFARAFARSLGMFELLDANVYNFTDGAKATQESSSGAGKFDLMAYGYGESSGGDAVRRPLDMSGYTRQRLGWLVPNDVGAPATPQTITIKPGDVFKVYPSGKSGGKEYFLLENRQDFAVYIYSGQQQSDRPAPGLIIWHIDESVVDNYGAANRVNSVTADDGPVYPGVMVVEADDQKDLISTPRRFGEAKDTWQPGSTWDKSKKMNALWNGTSSGITVSVLSQNADKSLQVQVQVDKPTDNGIEKVFTFLPIMVR